MDKRFRERLENWRRTVRTGTRQSACAAWARLYVASRVMDEPGPPPPVVSTDELDGWLVEAVWARLPRHRDKMALKYWHIAQLGELAVCSRLKIRVRDCRVVIANAEKSLHEALDKFADAATIAANNLHAGNVPCVLTLPWAGSDATKDNEALID